MGKWGRFTWCLDRISAQITIYAALSLALVLSLICTCIRSASLSVVRAEIDMAARLSVESVFAGYSKEMLEEFDIFVLDHSARMDEQFWQYAAENMNGICTASKTTLASAEWEDCAAMTDNGGAGLEEQILSYMAYGIYTELLEEAAGIEHETKKGEALKEITQNIADCEEQLMEADTTVLELVELVEGIQTEPGGLKLQKGNAVASGKYFAKAAITQPLSMEQAAVDTDAVYKAFMETGSKYTNVIQVIDDLIVDIEELQVMGDEESDSYGANSCAELYRRNINILKTVVYEVADKTQKALEKIENHGQIKQQCVVKFDKCMDGTEQNKELLGNELYESLIEDLQDMKRDESSCVNQLCNMETMQQGLQQNLSVLREAQSRISKLDITVKQSDCDTVKVQLESCKELLLNLSNKQLKFNYTGIDFNRSASGTGAISTLKKTLSEGIAGLVLSGRNISENAIAYTDLASESQTTISDREDYSGIWGRAEDAVLFDEYLIRRFGCYADTFENEEVLQSEEAWCELQYPLEYILCGNVSDKENLSEVIVRLSLIREGINLAYLITDAEKRNEAFALASGLVGFTGNMAVIKAAQYLILGVWAYGESIVDLRALFNGESIPAVKTKATWQLGLDKLLLMDFASAGNGEMISNREQDKAQTKKLGELSYKDYLRVLLLAESRHEKIYRTMDVMELRMIALGNMDFRMRNYIWAAQGIVTVKINGINTLYIRQLPYKYV